MVVNISKATKPSVVVSAALVLAAVVLVAHLSAGRDSVRTVVAGQAVGGQASAQTWRLALRPRNPSGRSGGATLTSNPDRSTRVRVDVSGAPNSVSVTIVVGTCSNPGPTTFTLNPIATGTSDTTIPISLDQLLNGKFSIGVGTQAGASEALSCGEIVGG